MLIAANCPHLPAGKSLDYTAVGLGYWNVSPPRDIICFILHKLPSNFSLTTLPFFNWDNFPPLSSPHRPLGKPPAPAALGDTFSVP